MASTISDTLTQMASIAVSIPVTYPIQRVLVLLQTQNANPAIVNGDVRRYTGSLGSFARIYRDCGITSLWSGCGAALMHRYTEVGVSRVRTSLFRPKQPSSFTMRVARAVAVSSFAIPFAYPFEFACTRLAAHAGGGVPQFTGVRDCLYQTIKSPNGFLSIYRGASFYVASSVAFVTCRAALAPLILPRSRKAQRNAKPNFKELLKRFLASVILMESSMMFAYPFKVMSRTLQMEAELPGDQRLYKSALDFVQQVVSSRGLQGLLAGVMFRLCFNLASYCVLVVYGEIRSMLIKRRKKRSKSQGSESKED